MARHALAFHIGLHFFIDQPFVGSVLVDDNHAVRRLRHDISFVQLRPRRAERDDLLGQVLAANRLEYARRNVPAFLQRGQRTHQSMAAWRGHLYAELGRSQTRRRLR